MSTTHHSEPYTIPARQWQAFAEGTRLRVVLGDTDHAITSADYIADRLNITVEGGDVIVYSIDEDVTVRAPRTTFAAIRAKADK